jgi:hypothetical protein
LRTNIPNKISWVTQIKNTLIDYQSIISDFEKFRKNRGKQDGFDAALVDRVLKLVNINEYKRNQFCPIIRISPKAFGVGRRVPIVAKYLS